MVGMDNKGHYFPLRITTIKKAFRLEPERRNLRFDQRSELDLALHIIDACIE